LTINYRNASAGQNHARQNCHQNHFTVRYRLAPPRPR
jgi:hypothetical protein